MGISAAHPTTVATERGRGLDTAAPLAYHPTHYGDKGIHGAVR